MITERPTSQPEEGSLASPFTPSELILRNAVDFTSKRLRVQDQTQVGTWASSSQVTRETLAAAFLANERAGAIHLEVRTAEKKFLFFRRTEISLVAVQGSDPVEWPAFSLESSIYAMVRRRPMEVSDIIHEWLGEDTCDPLGSAVELIKKGLVSRGLLRQVVDVVRKKWLFFNWTAHVTRYVLAERTEASAAPQQLEPALRLLTQCQKNRPATWTRLMGQIEKAISRRKLAEGG